MCVGIYLYICTPSLQMYLHRVYMYVCIYLHTCTPNTHAGVYIYIYTYKYEKTSCVHTECVHANTDIHVCVRILFTGVFYVCVGVYIYTCIHERHHGCIQIHYTGCA